MYLFKKLEILKDAKMHSAQRLHHFTESAFILMLFYQYYNEVIQPPLFQCLLIIIIMKFSKSPELNFFTSSYFLTNLALILIYPIIRIFTSAGLRDLRHLDNFGFTYENSIIYGGLTFVAIYYLRSASLRQFLLDCLTIGKIIVGSLLFFAKFRWCLIYIGVCLLSWLAISYPKYRGKNKFIKIQSEQHFDQLVGKVAKKKEREDQQTVQSYNAYQYRDKKMFFVQFYADWLSLCHTSKELWYEYSNRYSTPQLKFLQVNVSKLPQLAKRFSINTSGFTKQLPTIIIFDDGEQTCRFPPIKDGSKVDRIIKLDYKILLRYFDLESRYLETRLKNREKKQEEKKEV